MGLFGEDHTRVNAMRDRRIWDSGMQGVGTPRGVEMRKTWAKFN